VRWEFDFESASILLNGKWFSNSNNICPCACFLRQDLDEYKNVLKPRLKALVQNEDREWFIVFVLKSVADSTNKLVRRVYSKLENEFSSKRRERCCKLELHGGETAVWDDLESKIVECIRITLDRRVLYYEEEVRKLSETRFLPTWNFGNFFIVKVLLSQ
jgi:hypothetical protein